MNQHFTNLADYRLAGVRYTLLALHLPLLVLCFAIHTLGGVLIHSNNFIIQFLNSISSYGQNLMAHVIQGLTVAVTDINTVLRGR